MVSKQNQLVTTNYLLSTFLLVGFCFGLIGYIVMGVMGSNDRINAVEKARTLAVQVINTNRDHEKNTGDAHRNPASSSEKAGIFNREGFIGQDPWGRPYKYRFMQNDRGDSTHLVIWSLGPNKKDDSEIGEESIDPMSAYALEFGRDDVGTIVPIIR